jgi:hypothetical protein
VVSAVIGVELVLNFIVASVVSEHRDNDTIRTNNTICDGHHKKAEYLAITRVPRVHGEVLLTGVARLAACYLSHRALKSAIASSRVAE